LIPTLYGYIPVGDFLNLFFTTVGASGAIYAILLGFAMSFPNEKMFVFPLPFPIKAKFFVIGYALIELFLGFANTNDGIAHYAHLGGMLFGLVIILYWRKKHKIGGPYV
jgi:membrane associated rhomboid family serine protease